MFDIVDTQSSISVECFGVQIMCPVCKCRYVHIETEQRTPTNEKNVWNGRGVAITVPMWCEEGHSWDFQMGFHKGATFVKNENVSISVFNKKSKKVEYVKNKILQDNENNRLLSLVKNAK